MARSMTQGKEWKQILLFSLPLFAGNLLQQLYNAVDGIVVGNFAADTENALSAVGTCAPVTMVFLAFAIGMSGGCSVLISQLFGARRMEEMRQAVSTGLILVGSIGLVFSIVGGMIARGILTHLLSASEGYLDAATTYLTIFCFGLVFQFIYNIASFILRSLGDSKATLYFLLISSVVNILLDLLFVAVFHWDVPGVAVATTLAQMVSAVVAVVYMFRKYPVLRFSKGEFRFHKDKALLALRLGIPHTIQMVVVSASGMAVQRVVNDFELTAGYTAAMRVENFVATLPLSANVAMVTFTGQNIGAGKLDRVKRGLHAMWLMSAGISALAAVLISLFAVPLSGLFGVEGDALWVSVEYIRVVSPAMVAFALYMVTTGLLQGAGDAIFAATNSLICTGLRCVAAYVMAYLTPIGGAGIWYSPIVGWCVAFLLALCRYHWGPWRNKALTTARPDSNQAGG